MLILSRKLNESIVIDGRIIVRVMRLDGDVVKLGIAAPADVPVHRHEVYEEIRQSNESAVTQRSGSVPKLSASSLPQPARPATAGWPQIPPQPATEVKNPKPKQTKANRL